MTGSGGMMVRSGAHADPLAWWRDAVFYRIDVRSFADADGDGTGDLDGLRSRLGYVELLGVDAIVLAGVAGLDPADDAFATVLSEAHQAGIRVLIALDPDAGDPEQIGGQWLSRGLDGFHLDPRVRPGSAIREAVAHYPGRVLIGSGGGWHLEFNLDLAVAGFDTDSLHTAITQVMSTSDIRPAWAMATRKETEERDEATLTAVRSMALVQLALPGAVCLRHGEELGLPGTQPVPMPWEGDEPPFGFSEAPGKWPLSPGKWSAFTVEAQLEDPDSTLSLYRKALEIRRTRPESSGDEVEWFGAPESCFAFRRVDGGLVCALNTGSAPVPLPPGELLLSSKPLPHNELPQGTAAWLI